MAESDHVMGEQKSSWTDCAGAQSAQELFCSKNSRFIMDKAKLMKLILYIPKELNYDAGKSEQEQGP